MGNISRPPSLPVSETFGVMLVEFLNPEFPEYRSRGPKAFAYLYAFARLTEAEMTAILVHEGDHVYELLFNFPTAARREQFLQMLHENPVTDCPDSQILIPEDEEIMAAQPIIDVLPENVLREARVTHAMLKPIHGRPN